MATDFRRNPETYALIVGAGSGVRFGRSKAFYVWRGEPLISSAARPFLRSREVDGLVLVVRAEDVAQAEALARAMPKPTIVVAGGATRSASVREGLAALPASVRRVAVHDAARPTVSQALVERLLSVPGACAIPRLPLHDALHRDPALGGGAVPREGIWRVQTPQVFDRDLLVRAHQGDPEAADDGELVLRLGGQVFYVEGEEGNLKVTTPEDIMRLDGGLGALRIGHGFDVHRLALGLPLMLAGVEIPSPHGAIGHSDADVICHALMDAILGAAGLPDIGHFFPPGDPQFAGANSLALLRQVVEKVREVGYRVGNADCTLVLESPKVAPYRERMQAALAETLGVAAHGVSLKATTAEGLGFIGSGEGVAAWAVATLIDWHPPSPPDVDADRMIVAQWTTKGEERKE